GVWLASGPAMAAAAGASTGEVATVACPSGVLGAVRRRCRVTQPRPDRPARDRDRAGLRAALISSVGTRRGRRPRPPSARHPGWVTPATARAPANGDEEVARVYHP